MASHRITVVANNTMEGISVISVDVYDERRGLHIPSTKRLIDEINALPLLDQEKIRSVLSKQYGIPKNDIFFT